MAEQKSGSCLCGAVRFTASLESGDAGVCHCSMCRRATAGPFFAIECGPSLAFEDETQLGVYRSSDWAERGFCRKCGTPLFWRLHDKSMSAVSVNAFDDPGALNFTSEVFIDDKPAYYAFAGERKRMTGAEVYEMYAAGKES